MSGLAINGSSNKGQGFCHFQIPSLNINQKVALFALILLSPANAENITCQGLQSHVSDLNDTMAMGAIICSMLFLNCCCLCCCNMERY